MKRVAPPRGVRRRPWGRIACKEAGLLQNDGVVRGAPRPKGLGAKAFTLEAAYPLEGRYVRNGFSLGDFCFTVVQVEQTIFPVAHA